jgi:5,6-dimethylbenzimidazole synthase
MSYSKEEKAAIYKVIRERRDMRHFVRKPVQDDVLKKLINAARQAPSVGYMQPWRFIRIVNASLRASIHDMVKVEIERTAEQMGDKKPAYLRLKLEGIQDCGELWVAALMEGREDYVLGRRTMPEMDLASLSCAIQNIWLAARAEEIGLGWVSFFQPDQLASLLDMPEGSYPAAILCIGHVASFYPEPLLKTEGWGDERVLDELFFEDTWGVRSNLLQQ